MKASDCIVKLFESLNIDYVFGYQGGMITHLIDSLSKSTKTKYIQCYHEQSAAIAAEGYALESGNIGVAISTSGPGATNMLTGIADAYFGSIPVLYITGQVNTYEYKYDKKIRQFGFQETDIVSIVKPITKYAAMVNKVEDLESELKKAIKIAMSGRKGPVLLDLPMNIQHSDIEFTDYNLSYEKDYPGLDMTSCSRAFNLLKNSERPLVICGNGIMQSDCKDLVQEFLDKNEFPYVVSMLGKSCVNENSDNFHGVIGSYGNRGANIILSKADVVLALGSRLDLRQTGNVNSESLKKIQFIHVDIDSNELTDSKIPNKLNVLGSIQEFIEKSKEVDFDVKKGWLDYCKNISTKYSQTYDVERFEKTPQPYDAIKSIRSIVKQDAVFISDIGQNQVWTTQMLSMKGSDRFYTSGGLAPMGFAIPCAVGAAFANPNKKIVCITGDGGFHFALQSLMLIRQYNLNVVVYVLNNSSLGMITQFQTLYFDSNMAGTTADGGYLVPEIDKIALAYGMKYKLVDDVQNLNEYTTDRNTICEVRLPKLTTVVPKLEFNKELYDMIPYLTPTELKEIGGGYKCRVVSSNYVVSFMEAA